MRSLDEWFKYVETFECPEEERRRDAAEPQDSGFVSHSERVEAADDRASRPLSTAKETREELLARLLDPVLTLDEAAQVLNVCPTTVRRYTNKGLLQHYRTSGNQRRFRLSHVLGFMRRLDAGGIPGTVEGA